jgi:hypothetical protein
MDASEQSSITLSCAEVLQQVSTSMRSTMDLVMTVPVCTTWIKAIQATESALEERDEEVLFFPPPRYSNKRILRELALQDASSQESALNSANSVGLSVRSAVHVGNLEVPKRSSAKLRQILQADAKTWTHAPDPYPLCARAQTTEQTLAVVQGSLRLSGIDSDPDEPEFGTTSSQLLWDTGAHSSIIVEDLLPVKFREYLSHSTHDPYRSENQLRVHVDATIVFSNKVLEIGCIFLVVPRSAVPNGRVGIILGQRSLMDRLSYKCVPRRILVARGELVPETIWGDIVLEEYLTLEEELHRV